MKTPFRLLKHLLLVVSIVAGFGCQQSEKQVHVKVITTTDVHAMIFPYDFVDERDVRGSLAHVKTYVDEQRDLLEQSIILLDNGDLLQGQPTGYYYNYQSDRDVNLFADVLNYMEFDAASVGNHDVEAGPEVYNRLKDEFDFPWLAANILNKETGEPYFEPYTIIERKGVKIAVLGLVTSSVPTWLPRKLWEDLEFVEMYDAAVEWMQYIRDNEQPHAIIGLFHSGAGEDSMYDGESLSAENASLFVAKNIPGFDVVFTGHDHRVRNQVFENAEGDTVLMLAGQSYGRSLAVADLFFNLLPDGTYAITNKEGHIADMVDYDPAEEFMEKYNDEFEQVKHFVLQPLGSLQVDLQTKDAYLGNAAFVDFVHQMQLELTGAEVSFAAPLSFNAMLKEGDLSMKDMFNLYPFENYLYVMELTGEEIKGALEYSYGLWYNTMSSPEDHVMLFQEDEQGEIEMDRNNRARFANAFFNFDSAAGLNYEVDVSKPAGSRISISQLSDGEPFDLNKTYKVAVNSYRGSGGGGHLTQGAGIEHEQLEDRIVWVSEKDLRSHIADFIRSTEVLNPKAGDNWKVTPEEWAEQALERDIELVFPK